MQIRDEKHIRYLAEHLLHTGIGQLGRRDIHALRRIALRLQAQYDASVPEEGMTFGERVADRVAEALGPDLERLAAVLLRSEVQVHRPDRF
jgi:hypothetical protein